jgi:hypothetical protein
VLCSNSAELSPTIAISCLCHGLSRIGATPLQAHLVFALPSNDRVLPLDLTNYRHRLVRGQHGCGTHRQIVVHRLAVAPHGRDAATNLPSTNPPPATHRPAAMPLPPTPCPPQQEEKLPLGSEKQVTASPPMESFMPLSVWTLLFGKCKKQSGCGSRIPTLRTPIVEELGSVIPLP